MDRSTAGSIKLSLLNGVHFVRQTPEVIISLLLNHSAETVNDRGGSRRPESCGTVSLRRQKPSTRWCVCSGANTYLGGSASNPECVRTKFVINCGNTESESAILIQNPLIPHGVGRGASRSSSTMVRNSKGTREIDLFESVTLMSRNSSNNTDLCYYTHFCILGSWTEIKC